MCLGNYEKHQRSLRIYKTTAFCNPIQNLKNCRLTKLDHNKFIHTVSDVKAEIFPME